MATKLTKNGSPQTKADAGTRVPRQLATPTDLASADVAAITTSLNGLVADAFALYIKTKNFHWHLSGVHFRDLHLLFDEHADAIFLSIDLLAERVRRIGGTTIRSVGHVGALTSIADDDDAFVEPIEMVRRLREDNGHVVEAMRKAHEICDEGKDAATAGILENLIDEAERRVWFLYEVEQGLERH